MLKKIKSVPKQIKNTLKSKKGFFVDTGVKILICVVLGGLVLGGLYGTFNGTIMPSVKSKVESLFDYNGGSESGNEDFSGYATFSDGTTLSWEELRLPENGTKYGYSVDKITDTTIEKIAFQNCTQLTEINIQDGITYIGVAAFGNCTNLKTVNMSNSVTDIDVNAFYYCDSLSEVNLSYGITTISESMFKDCHCLKSIVLPDSVTSIGQNAFMYCSSLESITLSSNLESIDYFAFRECYKFKEIHFPKSIKTLKWGSFSESFVTDFYYEGTVSEWNAIDKNEWARGLSSYTVHCSDGNV